MGRTHLLVAEDKDQENQGNGEQNTTEQDKTEYPETTGPFSGTFFPHRSEKNPLQEKAEKGLFTAVVNQWQFL
jgi:hypothetical protein